MNTLFEEIPDYPLDINMNLTNTASVLKKLKSLNPHKAPGPDDIPNWILRDYAEILAPSVSDLLNSSYKQNRLPPCWKQANITPIPKEKPVKDISKQLRPISLTPVLSKLAEEFVVEKYIAPAVLSSIDPFQFGGTPRSSATSYPGSFQYAPRWRKDPGPGWSRVSQILGDNNWDLWGVGKANVAFEFKTIQGVRIKQHKGLP